MSKNEYEADEVQEAILTALRERRHFRVEAGAGAGKTRSLIDALQHILADRVRYLPRPDQRVACITYTNVARDEIINRTGGSPHVFADTIHGFLWQLLSPFRKHLLRHAVELKSMEKRLEGRTSLDGYTIDYTTGFSKIDHDKRQVRLGHDDLPALAPTFFAMPKFRALAADRFPIVFVDEYQDTPAGLVEALLGVPDEGNTLRGPLCGFFGDHWQQIYKKACGAIDQPRVEPITKQRNFRSQRAVVTLLNTMRPELEQALMPEVGEGTVAVYHTNEWGGARLTYSKKGQISWIAANEARRWVLEDVRQRLWTPGVSDNADAMPGARTDTKILMLTHETIADELGYQGIHRVFRKRKDSYVKKEDHVLAFLMDRLEPALDHYRSRRYGAMFQALGLRHRPLLASPTHKRSWTDLLEQLEDTRKRGTVGNVLDVCYEQELFDGLDKLRKRHRQAEEASVGASEAGQDPKSRDRAKEYEELRAVPYRELLALQDQLGGGTPFATQHGVKGQEFSRVLAVVSKGHTNFQIPEMLANFARRDELMDRDREAFVRARNLFYVACSRAREHLALLFITKLEPAALDTLRGWVGASRIRSLRFDGDKVVGVE